MFNKKKNAHYIIRLKFIYKECVVMRFLRGITAGAVIGAVAGMLIMPQLSWNTRRKFGRSGRMIRNTAEDLMGSMRSWSK